jgi:hypothetical protein
LLLAYPTQRSTSTGLSRSHPDLAVARLKPEVAGQAAAAGLQVLGVHAGILEQLRVGVPAHDGVLVTVHLGQHRPADARRLVARGVPGQQLGQGFGVVAQPAHVLVIGEQLGSVGMEHRRAARLQADHIAAGPDMRRQGIHGLLENLLASGQLATGDPGQAAADRLGGQLDAPAGRLQHLDRRLAFVRVEIVGERIRPEQHGAAVAVAARAAGI